MARQRALPLKVISARTPSVRKGATTAFAVVGVVIAAWVLASATPSLDGAGGVLPASPRFADRSPGTALRVAVLESAMDLPKPLISGSPPARALRIGTSTNPQAFVDSRPDGTAFVISAGVHRHFSVVPKSGDSFYTSPGAILDGEHSTSFAFQAFGEHREADRVTLVGASPTHLLVIRNYTDGGQAQRGTIQTGSRGQRATGWTLQWLDIVGSYSRGVSTSNNMVIAACHVDNSGRLGIGGGGSHVVVEGNMLDHNGSHVAPHVLSEAGGIKTVSRDIAIVGNFIGYNDAPGIWTDVDATNVLIANNHVVGNTIGIHIEISHSVTIRGNQVDDTLKAGIMVSASNHVIVTQNHLSHDDEGIIANEPDRGNGPHGPRTLNFLTITENVIASSGLTEIVQLPAGSVTDVKDNTYEQSAH
jgi:parallel beta-helix repeat protein